MITPLAHGSHAMLRAVLCLCVALKCIDKAVAKLKASAEESSSCVTGARWCPGAAAVTDSIAAPTGLVLCTPDVSASSRVACIQPSPLHPAILWSE